MNQDPNNMNNQNLNNVNTQNDNTQSIINNPNTNPTEQILVESQNIDNNNQVEKPKKNKTGIIIIIIIIVIILLFAGIFLLFKDRIVQSNPSNNSTNNQS